MSKTYLKVCNEPTLIGVVEYLGNVDSQWQRFEYSRMYIPTKEVQDDEVYCHCLKDALALVMKWNAADPRCKYWMYHGEE